MAMYPASKSFHHDCVSAQLIGQSYPSSNQIKRTSSFVVGITPVLISDDFFLVTVADITLDTYFLA